MEIYKTSGNLEPITTLGFGKKNLAGRSNEGRQIFFHQGGGRKLRYRIIDFRRILRDVPALVRRIEYDPNRTAAVAFLAYANETLSYILCPKDLKVNSVIYSCENLTVDGIHFMVPGSAHYLSNFAVGSFIHNLQVFSGAVAKYMRGFNASGQLLRKLDNEAVVKLKSGEHRLFPLNSIATLGTPSDGRTQLRIPGRKAGLSRHLNRRPNVRGCAMNPVDHPHGGGAAKGGTKRGVFSPWGKFSQGTKTAKYKLVSRTVVKSRHQAKKQNA